MHCTMIVGEGLGGGTGSNESEVFFTACVMTSNTVYYHGKLAVGAQKRLKDLVITHNNLIRLGISCRSKSVPLFVSPSSCVGRRKVTR